MFIPYDRDKVFLHKHRNAELMCLVRQRPCPFRLPSREIAHAGKKKVLRTFLFHHLELTRKEFRGSEVIHHMPAFHVVAGIAICTPHCAANDDIHVLNLIFDTNTHDFCHSSRFFLMRSRHSSNWAISSSEKPL